MKKQASQKPEFITLNNITSGFNSTLVYEKAAFLPAYLFLLNINSTERRFCLDQGALYKEGSIYYHARRYKIIHVNIHAEGYRCNTPGPYDKDSLLMSALRRRQLETLLEFVFKRIF